MTPEERKAYRAKNHARIRAAEKKYHEANIDARRETARKAAQAYRDANREKIRAAERESHWRREYGLTLAEYEELRRTCTGCKICGTSDWGGRGPVVDHCHDTKAVRGLLCNRCNLGLGLFDDDVEKLRSAVLYLNAHPKKVTDP